jgi:activator of 2-hydroxyglutaryl-CoA dehydratase
MMNDVRCRRRSFHLGRGCNGTSGTFVGYISRRRQDREVRTVGILSLFSDQHSDLQRPLYAFLTSDVKTKSFRQTEVTRQLTHGSFSVAHACGLPVLFVWIQSLVG